MNGSHEASDCRVPWKKIKENRDRTFDLVKGKVHVHYVFSYCNIRVTEDLFNTSFASLGDTWLLDTCATSHMTLRRYFFKYFDDNVDGIMYFSYRSSLKPSGMGTIRLKLPRLLNLLLHNVLCLFELQRILLSLVCII
jgi:hypothetical protein